jgi:hypothetical protein
MRPASRNAHRAGRTEWSYGTVRLSYVVATCCSRFGTPRLPLSVDLGSPRPLSPGTLMAWDRQRARRADKWSRLLEDSKPSLDRECFARSESVFKSTVRWSTECRGEASPVMTLDGRQIANREFRCSRRGQHLHRVPLPSSIRPSSGREARPLGLFPSTRFRHPTAAGHE